MSMKLVVQSKGLYTFPNQISQVPNGAMVQAANVVIDREGVVESRRGYNQLPGTFTSGGYAWQTFRFQNNLLSHYGPLGEPNKLGFYSPEVTITGVLSSGSNVITGVDSVAGLYVGQTINPIIIEQPIVGDLLEGSNTILNVSTTLGVYVGQLIGSIGIPLNTTITAIAGTGPYTITMSANSTYTKTSAAIVALNRNILGFPSGTTITNIGTTTVTVSNPATVNSRSETFSPSDVDVSLNTISIARNGLINGIDVQFTSTGTLPGGLSLNTNYFIVNVTDSTFQVSPTNGGAAIDLTAQGTGVHTLVISNSIQSYGWIDYSGNYLQPDSVTKLRSVESNSNVYFTTSTGVKKLDSITDTIVESGAPPGLDGFATLYTTASGFMPDNVQVAYRVVWGYKDANKNLILGAPSQRIEIANNTGSTKNVNLNITIPADVTTTYFYQLYRSGFSSDVNTPANDEMSLVYEANPTSTDITNKHVTILDETPESLRNGAALYTSPSQEGILQSNTQAPFCKDMTLFKGSVFYANTRTKQNMTESILAVSGQFQFFADIVNGSTTASNLSYTVVGDLTSGSNTISNISSTASLTAGQIIYDVTNSGFLPNDPANNNITTITDVVDANTIIISNPSSGTSTGDTLQIGIIGIEVGQLVTGSGIPANTTIKEVYTAITLTGNVVNGSPIVTNIPSTLTLAVGQPVSGPGVPSGALIQSIDSNTQVTLTANVNLTFTGNLAATSTSITNVASISFLVVNQGISGADIPINTVITAISGTGPYTLTISNASTNVAPVVGEVFTAAASVSPFSMTGNTVSNSNVISNIVISGSSKLAIGQTISDNTNTSAFPAGTTIISIIDPSTVAVSNNATASHTGDTFTVAPSLPPLAFDAGIQLSNPATATATTTVTAQNGSLGIQIGDAFTFAGTTYTAATVENISTKNFKVYAQGSPSQNIADTAQSLIRVINRTTGPTPTIYATYLSGFTDLPGKIYFQERIFGGGNFYATASSLRAGRAWSANLPTSGTSISSDNDTFANGLYYSKTQIPEAVPIVNFVQVGSAYANILRIIALRDSLFILKEDGVFRLTGQDPTSFQVDLFDSTTQIVSAESAVSLNNLIFCLSKYGIVTISDTGVTVISRAIEDIMLNLLDINITSAKNLSFGISYESDRKYIFFCITQSGDQYATQAYVYNTFTQTWTQWVLSQTCGIVHPTEDKLYLGNTASSTFDIERKTRTYTDYTDSSFSVNLIGVTGVTSTGSNQISGIPDTTNLSLGQVVAGIGIPTGSQIIAITSASTITLNKNATSSGTTTLLLDSGKTLALDNLANIEVGDLLYQTNGRYSIITAVNSLTNTVTVKDFIDNWVLGSSYIYKAYESIVQYVPQTAGNPGSIKQFRETSLLFQVPFFNQIRAEFNTDISAGNEIVLLNGLYGSQWGRFSWGGIPWGGTVKAYPIRTYIPQQKQRCSLMNLTIVHREAYAFYRLNGVTFTHNNLSERVGR